MRVHMYARMSACMHARMFVCMSLCMYGRVHRWMDGWMCERVRVCMHGCKLVCTLSRMVVRTHVCKYALGVSVSLAPPHFVEPLLCPRVPWGRKNKTTNPNLDRDPFGTPSAEKQNRDPVMTMTPSAPGDPCDPRTAPKSPGIPDARRPDDFFAVPGARGRSIILPAC